MTLNQFLFSGRNAFCQMQSDMNLEKWLDKYTDIEHDFYLNIMQNAANQNCDWLAIKRLLCMLDYNLQNLINIRSTLTNEHELQFMIDALVPHFKGQLFLHISSYILKEEAAKGEPNLDDATTLVVPLLFMAHGLGNINIDHMAFRELNENMHRLAILWQNQSNFRLIQAARTLESFFADKSGNINIEFETNWRHNLYHLIFENDSMYSFRKASYSYFLSTEDFNSLKFEWPNMNAITELESQMHASDPSQLAFQVYLLLARLKNRNSNNMQTIPFEKLNQLESDDLNQIDIDTFLYATALQSSSAINKLKLNVLPFANMAAFGVLCTDEQVKIWSMVSIFLFEF